MRNDAAAPHTPILGLAVSAKQLAPPPASQGTLDVWYVWRDTRDAAKLSKVLIRRVDQFADVQASGPFCSPAASSRMQLLS